MVRKHISRRNPSAQKAAQPRDPARRSQVVATRITPLEHQQLLAAAVAAHLSLSDFLRRLALGQISDPVAPAPSPAGPPAQPRSLPPSYLPVVREINAIGVNLNQLARLANASGCMPAGLDPVLEDINRALDRLIDLERSA